MKTLKTILSIAALSLLVNLSPIAHAGSHQPAPTGPQPKSLSFGVAMYRVKNSLTMNLLIEKKLGDQLVVRLIDEKGTVLHSEFLGRRSQKTGRLLNFGEAKDGTYTVVIQNGDEQLTKQISLSTQTLYEMPKRLLIAGN